MSGADEIRAALERTASEGRNYLRDASDDEAAVLEDFALYLLSLLDDAERDAARVLRIVRTSGRHWRFGPWPIRHGWGFDLGRCRLVYAPLAAFCNGFEGDKK